MRKQQKSPTSMSWRQFIFGPGRADAVERTLRYAEEEKEARKRKLAELESSNRAEERNREDAERSARRVEKVDFSLEELGKPGYVDTEEKLSKRQKRAYDNVGTTAVSNQFGIPIRNYIDAKKKDYIDDATYSNLTTPLVNKDNKKWYQTAADFVLSGVDRLAGEIARIVPRSGMPFFGDASLYKTWEHRKLQEGLQKLSDWHDNYLREKELSTYSQKALDDAETRMLKLRRENAEAFDDLGNELKMSITQREVDYRNLIGPSVETINAAHQATMQEVQEQAVDMPEGYFDPEIKHDRYGRIYYGKSPWMKDVWSQAMQNMNLAQRDNFKGMQVRQEEMKSRALNAIKYNQALIDIDDIPVRLLLLDDLESGKQLSETQLAYIAGDSNSGTALTFLDINGLRKDLNNKLNAAKYAVYKFKGDSNFIESYDPAIDADIKHPLRTGDRAINRALSYFNTLVDKATNGWYGDYSYTASLADEVSVLNENLFGLRNMSPDLKIATLNKYIEEGDKKHKQWQKGVESNQADIEKWKDWHEVTDYFKYRERTSDGAVYKPGTWMYKQPGLWGSSQASWVKQTAAMGINVASGFATGGLATIGGLAGLGLATSSSYDENNAEVAQGYRDKFKRNLEQKGLVKEFFKSKPNKDESQTLDEAIEEYSLNPWEFGNKELDEANFDAMHGSNSLFQDDMMAVTGDNILDTYLQIMPFARYARATKPSNGISLSAISPTLTAVKYTGGKTVNALAKTAMGKAIAKETQATINYARHIPSRLLGDMKYKRALVKARKANRNVFGTNSIPHRVLGRDQYVTYQTLKDFGKDVAGAMIESAISEGIEEGKQYLNAQAFLRGDYDDDLNKSIFNVGRLINDASHGIQSAIAALSLLPFMPALTDDAEFIENIQGGMLGGMFQTGAVRTLGGSLNTIGLMRMNDFIANEIALEKQASRDIYEKAKLYARKANDKQAFDRIMYAVDMYADVNQHMLDNGAAEVSKEDVEAIKDLKNKILTVRNIANDSRVQKSAQEMGVRLNSDQYHQYVATIAMFDDSRKQAADRNKEAQADLKSKIQSISTPFELKEDGHVVNNVSVANALKLQQEVKMNDAEGNPLKGQELLDAAVQRYQSNVLLYATIAALQSMKLNLEETLSYYEGDVDAKTKRDLRYQLGRVNRMLRAQLLNIKPDKVETVREKAADYISHLENSDEILNAAHRTISSTIDVDYHEAILNGLLGNYVELNDKAADENAEDLKKAGYKNILGVVKDIEASISNDRKLSNNIEKDWLYQYNLLDDKYLDNFEQQRRQHLQELNKQQAAAEEREVETQLEAQEEELINNAGAFEMPSMQEDESALTLEEAEASLAPNTDNLSAPKDTSEQSTAEAAERNSEALNSLREAAKKAYLKPESTTIELEGIEKPITSEHSGKKKYKSPKSSKFNISLKMSEKFAEMQDLLDQLANIDQLDLINVREETAWAAKRVEDEINQWMLETIASQDDGPVQLDALSQELRQKAEAIFDAIREEIKWASGHKVKTDGINFADPSSLKRKTYFDEDVKLWESSERIKFEQEISDAFVLFVLRLRDLKSEILRGQHLQDGQIDSPTSTLIDEAIATVDTLVDDAAQLMGIDVSKWNLQDYVDIKQWFANNHQFDGSQSEPIRITPPALRPQPTNGPAVGEVLVAPITNKYEVGINESVSEDGTKLSDVMHAPDFIEASIFELKVVPHKGTTATVDKIAIVVHYEGKTFSPVMLNSMLMKLSKFGTDFYNAVLHAYNFNEIAVGQHIEPVRVSRTMGSPKRGVFESPMKKGLVSTTKKDGALYLYDIEFGPNQTDFGETSVRVMTDHTVTYVTTPNLGTGGVQQLHEFAGNKDFKGAVIYMLKRAYSEYGDKVPKLPVLFRAKKMTEGDARLIIDIVNGQYNPQKISGRESLSTQIHLNGENAGITGGQLISLLIPQSEAKDFGRNRLHFDVPYGTLKFQVIGRIEGDEKTKDVPVREYDLSTDEGRKRFIEDSKKFEIAVDNQFMSQRFGDGKHTTDHPFHRLFQSTGIVRRLKAGETVTFGDSSISVDISDVINPNDASDVRGLSGLAWMIKRGLLETSFDGFDTPKLIVDTKAGTKISNNKKADEELANPKTVPVKLMEQGEVDPFFVYDPFFNKVAKESASADKLNEKEVRRNLARILGKDFEKNSVVVQDSVIDTCVDGVVIGRCYADSIVLSREGYENGVEYHEAFHRILEIVCPKRLRQLAYNAYRNRKPGAKSKTNALLAELMADDFMYYALNRPTFKLSHGVQSIFTDIRAYINTVKNIGGFRMYLMYALTNSGILNKVLHVSKDRQEAFNKIHSSGMNKAVRGTELDKVVNSAMYRDLTNSMIWFIFKTQGIDETGRNILNIDIDNADKIFRASTGYKNIMASNTISQNTKDALNLILDNWDKVKPDIAAKISKFSTDYKVVFEELNREDLEGDEESIASAEIGDMTKETYEFSQFSRATSRVRFFFSAIPNCKWGFKNGIRTKIIVLNKQGLGEFANPSILFNTILNQLHECRTYDEIILGLEILGQEDARIHYMWERLKTLRDLVKSGKGTAEDEALLTQIKTIIHSAKNEYMLAMSLHYGGAFTINLQLTDAEYDARQYVQGWQEGFSSGASSYISISKDGNYAMKNNYCPTTFNRVADRILEWANAVNNSSANPNDVKETIVKMLRSFYIQIDKDTLDFMLLDKYGSSGLAGLQLMFVDPQWSIIQFANDIRTLVNSDGKLVVERIGKILGENAFVKELGDIKYKYRHAHDQLSVLATEDKRYYVMSENNFITDQTDNINRREEEFDELMSYSYNIFDYEDPNSLAGKKRIGSIALKYMHDNPNAKISFASFVGFKTDEVGDEGNDYANISTRQDYVAKAAMLLRGALLLPALADKKTWGFIQGLPMPGLKFTRVVQDKKVRIFCNFGAEDSIIPDDVVDQMLEYAQCEYRAIKDLLAKIESMPEDLKVDNLHKSKDGVIQGARFSSLLGVWKNGKFIEFNRTKDENGKPLTEQDNLDIAEKYFFSQSISNEERKKIIRELLRRRAFEEMKTAESLGLVRKIGKNYQNVGLDQMSVDAVKDAILGDVDRSKLPAETIAAVENKAVWAIIADISNKHIISMEEGQRVFYGNPAAYKWKYDSNGHLIDLGSDLHKRLGGLSSTGQNNDLEIEGMPSEYTCAEIDDIEVISPEVENIRKTFEEGEFRQAYLNYLYNKNGISFDSPKNAKELIEEVNKKTLDEIKDALGKDTTAIVQALVNRKVEAFNEVNVADGASYISDRMAENLLRMVGVWDSSIERAFKILRGEEVDGKVYTTKDIREVAEAYEKVFTTVIGTQKYTAFGLRKNGDTLVPYYNKTALFPLFKCMCTGNTADLYELMKKQGVDMVMTKGAVKLGGQGSQKLDFDKLEGFTFNTYKQKYSLLRKLFNTDPKEKDVMKVGTQSAKVAAIALTPGRSYTVGDKTYSGTEIRDRIMEDQNLLSDLGVAEITDKFFDVIKDADGNIVSKTLNVEKLSDILTEELTDRGASSELLDAVSIVERNGKKQLNMPLAAISGLNWIQSILVSRVNKKVVDINTPGAAFIQRSVWGMEHSPKMIGDENLPPSINNGERLKFDNENGSMDCVLSIDYFEHLIPQIPRRDEDGHIVYQKDDNGNFILDKDGNRKPVMMRMPFEQARQWLIDQGIIGGEPNIFGYRIPTQAISSIHALRCVDVLPVVRDTVVLPAEFTKITGSDKQYRCSNLKKSL